MVDHINNGEEGFSVREKLNTVIDRTNTLNGVENQVEANKNLSQQNKARIDKEIQDRVAGDNALDARVDKEIADRKAADQANKEQSDGRIDQEIEDRTAADGVLQDQIDALVLDSQSDVNSVNGKTGNVVIDYTDVGAAAVDHLHEGVYQPVGDYATSAELSAEEEARISADANLQDQIDNLEEAVINDGGFVDAPDDGEQYARQAVDGEMEWTPVSEGVWSRNGDDIYYDAGNVGIGVDNPKTELNIAQANNDISSGIRLTGANLGSSWTLSKTDTDGQGFEFGYAGSSNSTPTDWAVRFRENGQVFAKQQGHFREPDDYFATSGWYGIGEVGALASSGGNSIMLTAGGYRGPDTEFRVLGNSTGVAQLQLNNNNGNIVLRAQAGREAGTNYQVPSRMVIYSSGEVGIGMTPVAATAAAQLANWKSELETILEDNPDLEVKAAVRQATDDEFEVMPTEQAVEEWLSTRVAGDTLQVGGPSHFQGRMRVTSGNIEAVAVHRHSEGAGGFLFDTNGWVSPVDNTGTKTNGELSLGNSGFRFKDLWLGGDINAGGNISVTGQFSSDQPGSFGCPGDFWAESSGWYGVNSYGGLCTEGSYGVSLVCNGYRNKNNEWTTLNNNNKTGAAEVRLLPEGNIAFYQDSNKATGSSSVPPLRANFYADGGVKINGSGEFAFNENGGTALTVKNSNSTASHGVKVIHGGGGTGTYPFFSETTGGVETFRVDGAGNVIAKGTVTATETKAIPDTIYWKNSAESVGLRLSATEMYPVNAANSGLKSNTISVGAEASKFKNGYFTGVVDAGYFTTTADNYFISRGSGGWMNATHGGGWYQSDATWVRTYGNKAVYVGNTGANAIAASGDIVAYYSDERLKDVQGPIENPLDKVDAIETFYYTHNDIAKSLGYEGDEVQVGVSAQSVKAVMPEVVCRAPVDMDADGGSLTGEDYMTVKYERLVPLLLESIKELRKEIEELKRG